VAPAVLGVKVNSNDDVVDDLGPGVAGVAGVAVVAGAPGVVAVMDVVAGATAESIPSIISRSLEPHTAHMKSRRTTITSMLKYGLVGLITLRDNIYSIILYFILIIIIIIIL
jgi:hypothetical protein